MQNKILQTLLVSVLTFIACSGSAQSINNRCTVSEKMQQRLQEALKKSPEAELTYFVGLYSKIETPERAELSQALAEPLPRVMAEGIEKVQATLAERLRLDKELLQTWLIRQDLHQDVEILRVPENNHFILFKAPSAIATQIVCASATGELPATFSKLGF